VLPDVLDGVFGVLDHVVEQRRTDACGSEPYLTACYPCHGYGVHDVGFAGPTPYALVGFFGEVVCALDYLHLFAVVGLEVAVEHVLKRFFNHAFLFLRAGLGVAG
jgi:hypothetical protein